MVKEKIEDISHEALIHLLVAQTRELFALIESKANQKTIVNKKSEIEKIHRLIERTNQQIRL